MAKCKVRILFGGKFDRTVEVEKKDLQTYVDGMNMISKAFGYNMEISAS